MKTASGMREQVTAKAATDEAFRARLLKDPRGTIGEELGVALPAGLTIEVHEEGAAVSHLVLPPSAALDETTLGQAQGADMWDGVRFSLGIKS